QRRRQGAVVLILAWRRAPGYPPNTRAPRALSQPPVRMTSPPSAAERDSAMARTLVLVALALVFLAAPAARAAEDEPEFNGRKLSEYLDLLKKLQAEKPASDQDNERGVHKRQVILDVL